MSDSAKVGVVTVTYNSEKVIDAFMHCMLKQDHENFVLYVIDNRSDDSTLKRVSHYQDPRIVVIANQRNVGVAEGNNQGIRAAFGANCQYILLVNNDTEFDPHLISSLYESCQQYECDMTVPKIMYYDRPDVIWYAGAGFSRLRGYSGPHRGLDCKDTGQFDVPCRVDYAPTCCMFLRCEVFQRVGLMDARYFLYFDDTDFCFRARRIGQKLYYVPSIRLFHKVSSLTGGGASPVHIRYTTRNHVYYLAKNLGWLHCLYYLPLYQLKIAAKFLSGRLSAKGFRASESGFWEGFRMSFSLSGDDGDRLLGERTSEEASELRLRVRGRGHNIPT